MRIFFLGKRHYTNKDALAEKFGRIYQLPRFWAAAGNDVRLRLFDYRSLGKESAAADGMSVLSLPVANPGSLLELRNEVARFRPDILVASGDCFLGLIGLRLARATGAHFVFDVYDDYARFGGYRAFLGWNALGFLLQRADLVLYASRALAERHRAPSPWHLTPNGVDPERFYPMDMSAAKSELGIDPAVLLVGYFGGMEPDRGVQDLISAIFQLRSKRPTLRLLLCGNKPSDMDLDQPWIDYRGMVPHWQIPPFINACDVVAVPYRRSQFMDMGASCKIAEFLLCQRPMVATETPNFNANFPLQAGQLGEALCRSEDPADLARAIEFQLSASVLVDAPTEYSWPQIAGHTLQSFHVLLNKSGLVASGGIDELE
jgi:glycosyltransferase involved in cell wall biosynthesis